jgi:hypothetical protein
MKHETAPKEKQQQTHTKGNDEMATFSFIAL